MILRGRRINNFADFSLNACSAAMGIWVSSINSYINDTDCPPQPQVWRVPKLNLEFHDSTQKINVFKKIKINIQGVSHWNVHFLMVLRGRRINNFAVFSLNACSAAMGIWVSSINFYINDTDCPPQPQFWRLSKLNLEFHDSTQKINVFKTSK